MKEYNEFIRKNFDLIYKFAPIKIDRSNKTLSGIVSWENC